MKADLIIHNIKTLYTPHQKPPLRKEHLSDIKEINDCYVAVKDGKIIQIGTSSFSHLIKIGSRLVDAKGKIAFPGFVDAHSHLVHAGSREEEFALLKEGVPYLDILEGGGGILNTVRKTRAATSDELYEQAEKSLEEMIKYGVTTLELKSGYGLNLEQEIKQLEVAKRLKYNSPVHLSITAMEAHAIAPEFRGRNKEYVQSIIDNLKEFKNLGYVETVDVFCEKGVFDLEETELILNAAKDLGFNIRMHADELEPIGGAGLAVKLGALSADHLIAASEEDLILMGKSDTFACVLPGTSFYLQKPYAKARFMVDNNVAVCIAGDYNPGSCPTENYLLVLQIAANYLNLTPYEILSAATLNPAHLLQVSNSKGSLEVNKDADILLLDAPNLSYVFYHYGINHVTDVFIKGKQIIEKGKRI